MVDNNKDNNEDVTLVRINDKYNDIAYELQERAVSIKDDCATAIKNILN